MKCNIHNEKYIWFSELHEIENTYYCNKCINDMIEEDMYLTSNNWDSLYEYYINELQLENFFNYVEKYGWPKIIHQFTLKILFLIKNLLKVTLFSVKIH